MEDFDEMYFLRTDPGVMKYIDRPPLGSREEAEAFMQRIFDNVTNNESIFWAIRQKDSHKMIGNISIWRLMKEDYRGELGYTLHPAHQGKGIMNEALQAVLLYAFNTMKLHSIEAGINPDNAASRQLLERNGFIREAYFRDHYFFNGHFHDSAIYSLLTPHK
jgi:ribosomal-protein-alanine N-acetyltransferase